MTYRLPLFALLACAAASVLAAAPGPTIRPGLWALDNKVSSSDPQIQSAMGEMQKQLANMSPDQRQSLQQLMDRNGVQLQLADGGNIHSSVCVTREMAERKTFPVQGGACSQDVTPLSGNRFKLTFNCTKPRAHGEGEIRMDSDTGYRGRVQITSQERSGTVDMDVSGRWVGADCGGVKPAGSTQAR
jgi:hypothetical protein